MLMLIVDDEKYNRELLVRMAKHLGWLADEAEGGKAAIAACAAARYDAVLLDLNMPDMYGEDVAKALRALPDPDAQNEGQHRLAPLKIILVSGADSSRLKYPDLFDAILPKPFVLGELKLILEKVSKS